MQRSILFLVAGLLMLTLPAFAQVTPPQCPQQPCGTQNLIALSDRVVAPGSTIQMAVKVSTLRPIYGMDFQVQFPRDSVYPQGFWLSNWPFCSYPVWADYWNDSLYHFALASADSFCTDGIFGYLRMHIEKGIDSGTVLRLLLNGSFSDTTSSFAVPAVSGSIIVGPSVMFGDWNNDTAVSVPDVVGILRYSVHGGTITTRQLLAGDVSGDGFVDAYDAYLTIYKMVNPFACFPVEGYGCFGGGGGRGITQPVGVTLVERNGDVEVSFTPSNTITNGELTFKIPAGATVESIRGLNALYEFDRTGNEVKVAFVGGGEPIIGKPVLIIRGASPHEITITGKVNEGIPIGEVSMVTGVEDVKSIPQEFALEQNYPNPFNPTTTIAFVLPKAVYVSLKVYNLLGEEVATLVNGERTAGKYEACFDAAVLPSGVYVYRLQAAGATFTRRMLLVK